MILKYSYKLAKNKESCIQDSYNLARSLRKHKGKSFLTGYRALLSNAKYFRYEHMDQYLRLASYRRYEHYVRTGDETLPVDLAGNEEIEANPLLIVKEGKIYFLYE